MKELINQLATVRSKIYLAEIAIEKHPEQQTGFLMLQNLREQEIEILAELKKKNEMIKINKDKTCDPVYRSQSPLLTIVQDPETGIIYLYDSENNLWYQKDAVLVGIKIITSPKQ